MILKFLSLSLRATPVLATAVAAIWAGKKIMEMIEAFKIKEVSNQDLETSFKNRKMIQFGVYMLDENKDSLAQISFTKKMGEFDFMDVANFEYDGVLFAMQKYQQVKKYQYSFLVDFESLKKQNVVDVQEFCLEFIESMGISENKKVDFDININKLFEDWKKPNDKKTEVVKEQVPKKKPATKKVVVKKPVVAKKKKLSK